MTDLYADAVKELAKINADKEFISQFQGKTISEISHFRYMGRFCIEEIKFSDGAVFSLSGSCDNCNLDYVEDSNGERITPPENN